MTLTERWRRLDACAWVHRICILYAVVAGVMTLPALFAGFGLAGGSPSLWSVLWLVTDAVVLLLLVHPDGREVLDPPPPAIHVGAARDTTGAGW